jgi:hypothetical protein
MKYLLSALVGVGLVALIFYLHTEEVDKSFQSGYDKRSGEVAQSLVEAQDKIRKLEETNNTALANHIKVEEKYKQQLADAKRRFNNVTPEIQRNNGLCNIVLGDISLLNSAKGYSIGSTENPSLDDQGSKAASTITTATLIRDTELCSSQYESLRLDYLELAGTVQRLGLVSGQP